MVPIRFFGTMRKEDLALNEYVVTNQWIYPQAEGGKRLDIVLLINGFPIAIGELKLRFVVPLLGWMRLAIFLLMKKHTRHVCNQRI